jgi:DNA (cytosine-5)-methyltransferase 1
MKTSKRGGYREHAGRTPKSDNEKKIGYKVYFAPKVSDEIEEFSNETNFSRKVSDLVVSELTRRKSTKSTIKFIDLFAGMGGLRIGFEQAIKQKGYNCKCILTSEIKPHAIKALKYNFKEHNLVGDIKQIEAEKIEDFDFLLAGFPCQAFSSAGKGHGFLDTRGTLFFEVERILKEKRPKGFLLENVEGLVAHDRQNRTDKIGNTLRVILESLQSLGYKINYKVLDSKYFGLPQSRKRIYITGTLDNQVVLDEFEHSYKKFGEIREHNLETINSDFTKKLLLNYELSELNGKAIKDKRGGKNNIHSWDIELKGTISNDEKNLLTTILCKRRHKKWAEEIGIDWMDGMPLTYDQISTFYSHTKLKSMLDNLVNLGYLKLEHPKKRVKIKTIDGKGKYERIPDKTKEKGYNIVSGKLSFEFTKFIDNNDITPTIVAMDASRLGVVDDTGVRQLSLREGLRLFGYPEDYSLSFFDTDKTSRNKAYDLLGNTVTIPVVRQVSLKVLNALEL